MSGRGPRSAVVGFAVLIAVPSAASAQTAAGAIAAEPQAVKPRDVLSPAQWQVVDAAVARALVWLASEQRADGSFPTIDSGQPGVTALCSMAFIAHGHLPGEGDYGSRLELAADFVLACQKENGLVALAGPEGPEITRTVSHEVGTSTAYNHAISSLMLAELYGMSGAERAARIEKAVFRSLRTSLQMQRWPKERPEDEGGWRYIHEFDERDSDLSITGWELMFLRSARNAGFDVPEQAIDAAVRYVRRNYKPQYGTFGYTTIPSDTRSRGMAGAGILALAHAGFHNSIEARRSAEWLERHDFDAYNQTLMLTPNWSHDRYHYGLFNSCQAMYQLGGRRWERFFPRVVRTLLENQQADGSWPAESRMYDSQFGNAYTTALVVMALGASNQLLPIFQR